MRGRLAIAVVALALVGTTAGAAVAAASTPTVVSFSHWIVIVLRHGKQVSHQVALGGTLQRCNSQRLYKIEAFYATRGPSSGPDIEYWQLNGKLHNNDRFTDKALGRSGAFALFDTHAALPSGSWKLIIDYAGKQVGQASMAVAVKQGC